MIMSPLYATHIRSTSRERVSNGIIEKWISWNEALVYKSLVSLHQMTSFEKIFLDVLFRPTIFVDFNLTIYLRLIHVDCESRTHIYSADVHSLHANYRYKFLVGWD